MAEETNESYQELLDAASSSKWAYENDVQTLSNNINILDRTSTITDRYCNGLLSYLGSDTCSSRFDSSIASLQQLM